MNAGPMLLGLAPWFVFAWLAERLGADHVTIAALAACALSVIVAGYERARGGGWKILDVAGVVLFGAIAAVGIVGGHGTDTALVAFGRGGSAFVLAAVMAVSAFTIPFTEQYARETVDRQYWNTPIFRAKNRRISLVWAGAVGLMAVAHVVAGVLAEHASVAGSHPGNILLNWVAPVALILFAVKRTRAIADEPTPTSDAATAPAN